MITCHIVSIPERLESLKLCVESIYPQVDKVYVMLNGYTEVPSFFRELQYANCELLDNSFGDAAKWLHVNDDEGFVFTLDDDLIVSHNYINYLIYGIEKYGGAVSLHGKTYANRPIKSFKKSITHVYRCLGNVGENVGVDVIGTGCMGFSNLQIKVDDSVFQEKNMADVLFSRLCHNHRYPMTVMAHKAEQFLRYIHQSNTIWRNTRDDSVQTKILNSFLLNWGVI